MAATTLALRGGIPVRSKPWPAWPIYDERDLNALKEVLESRQWCRLDGKKVEQFEEAFAKYQDARFGIAVVNGTAALELALKAVGIEAGDEVIVPAFTFIATAFAPLQLSAIPIFADVEVETANIDSVSIEANITPRTRAIMPVHVGGRACDMDRILALARKHNLIVIEDACHGWGSTWNGRKVGAIGTAGGVSFQQSKNLTAGEGGIILTNDEDVAGKCYSLQTIGRVKDRPFYEHYTASGNYRLSEFQGALLLAQLERLEDQTQRRWDNALYLDTLLKDCPCLRLQRTDPWVTRSSVHIYAARYVADAMPGVSRQTFLEALYAEGVPAWAGWPHPLYRNPVFSRMNFGRKGHPYTCSFYGKAVDYNACQCPATEQLCRETVWLRQSFFLAEREDMRDIARAIEKIWDNREALRV